MRRWALRTARALFATALALEGAYVAGVNLLLSTPLFVRVFDVNPLDVDIHYTTSSSPARSSSATLRRAEDIALRGAYAVRDGVASGGFVVEKGPVSLGVHLGSSGPAIQAFGLDAWLRDQIGDAMRIARCAPLRGAERCVVP